MPLPSRRVKAFFAEYESGANTFDVQLNVREREKVWLSADPHSVTAVANDNTFPKLIRQRQQQLLQLGYIGAKITSLKEIPLDSTYSLVKTAWRQTYRQSKKTIFIDITVDYIIRIGKDTITILVSVAHEDENALLKAQGVL